VNGSPRHNATARAVLVAVALGAVVAGSATVATRINAGGDPVSLASGSTQIANAEELPAPGAPAKAGSAASSTSGAPTTTVTATTTTSPTTTTSAPPSTTTNAPVPPSAPATTPTQPSSHPTTSSSQAAQVFQLANQVRQQYGCSSLREDSRLDNSAVGHSEDMAEHHYFSHNGPGSTAFDKRIESYGYRSPGGENIAEGQTSAQQVFNAWMSDSGHRDNILNCHFVAMGVGVVTQGWYWTQDFGY
jgi:uncharacterized protein YkwD